MTVHRCLACALAAEGLEIDPDDTGTFAVSDGQPRTAMLRGRCIVKYKGRDVTGSCVAAHIGRVDGWVALHHVEPGRHVARGTGDNCGHSDTCVVISRGRVSLAVTDDARADLTQRGLPIPGNG